MLPKHTGEGPTEGCVVSFGCVFFLQYRWLCQFVFVPLYGVLLFKWPRTCCFFFVALQLHLELVLVSCSITKLPYSGRRDQCLLQ